jgi:general secretion pathway protein G
MIRARRLRGFTLIELAVTVAIVGVLSTMALPLAETTIRRGKEAELRTALRQIREGIDAYKRAGEEGRIRIRADASGYPPRLEDLVEGVEDIKRPDLAKIHFLRRLPRDPFGGDPELAAAETWGRRSYASPPDNPQSGEDVFDVYSLAEGVGLNGIPYRQW